MIDTRKISDIIYLQLVLVLVLYEMYYQLVRVVYFVNNNETFLF